MAKNVFENLYAPANAAPHALAAQQRLMVAVSFVEPERSEGDGSRSCPASRPVAVCGTLVVGARGGSIGGRVASSGDLP